MESLLIKGQVYWEKIICFNWPVDLSQGKYKLLKTVKLTDLGLTKTGGKCMEEKNIKYLTNFKSKFLIVVLVVILSLFWKIDVVNATCSSGIKGNGINGISININAAPYTTFASYPWGQYAYGKEGCAWFASARVKELTGKGSAIYSGWAWYNTQYGNYGFSIGSEPRARSLACYGNHVAVVEAVNGDTITVSQGGMSGLSDIAHGYCVISTMSRAQLESQGGCGTFYGYVYMDGSEPQPTVNNPFGYLDRVTAEMGKITVHGWAADMDAPNNPIDVHFYTVQNGQRVGLGAVTASEYRSDIRKSYPNINEFHGFTATFNTGLSGNVQVEAYGINVGSSGTNAMLWNSPKTVSVPKDTISPTISNVIVSNISSSGYTVTCDVSDNIGLSSVQFPTWSHTNGQDDLIWHEGKISGNKATCTINVSDHKGYVNCTYQTDIYAYDKAGNCTAYINKLFPYIDATPPTISDVEIVDVSETGYTVKCKVTDDHSKIDRVQFPTWFEENNPFNADWSWKTSATYSGKLEDGKYVFRVNTSKYNNQIGKYHTDIYAWDVYGNCSKSYNTETIIKKAHRHDYISSIKKPATCTETGIRLYTCKDNDDSYEETIPATGHQHTELRNVKVATCAQEGYTGDTYCKDCNTKLTSGNLIAKKEHTWDGGKITTAATCSGKGIKTYTCTGCNTTRTEEIPATGHQHTELRNVKAATCAQQGYTGDTYCKDCNTKLTSGNSIAKKEHTWNAGKITTAATCSGKGIKTYTCTVCNTTKTEEIPATGHQHTELRNVKEATCAYEGYTGDTYCKDCNTKLSSGKAIAKTEHTWDTGKITQNATCTTKGIKTFTCTICESTRIQEIPETGHINKITKFVKETSCTSEGYTGDVYCQECGKLLEKGTVIPKTEHTWNAGEVTKQPTTAETGIKTYTCSSCGATRTETLAKLKPQTITPGKIIKDKVTNGVYKVQKDGLSVEFTKPVSKNASVKIPDTIKVNGITCKVTGISANAFKNNVSLKTVTIGKNVTIIGTNAFYGCKRLSKVNGANNVVKIGNNSFTNCGSLSSITVSESVRTIGKQAFYNCKNLKTITIKTSALSTKTIGSNAFTGTYKKPTIKVPAKQMNAYKKLFRLKGMSSKAIYKK